MQKFLEHEASRFSELGGLIEAKLTPDEDIPAGLVLANIPIGPVYDNSIIVARKRETAEKWIFRDVPDIKDFTDILSDLTKEGVLNLANKLEIDESEILEAALLTRTLIDNFSNETAVVLDRGPEILRLIRLTSREFDHGGIVIPSKPLELEYYLPVGLVKYQGLGVPLMYRLANTGHKDTSFNEIFPSVLLFSATVDKKHRLLEAEVITQEEEEPVLPKGLTI